MKLRFLLFSISLAIFSNSFAQKKSANFKPTTKFGGRIMFDYGFNKLNDVSSTGNEFRRLRSFMSGNIAKNIAYKVQIDYSKGRAVVNDAFIKFKKLPKIGGSLTIGNFKEPSSLNILTSSKYITFLEAATLVNYHQARSTGLMYNTELLNKRMGFQLAFNSNSNSDNGFDNKLNEGQNVSVRLTGLAISDKKNNKILHLGARFSNRVPSKNDAGIRTYKIGVKPESHLASKIISQTFTDVNHINLNGFELAYTSGAFSLQSEYTSATINTQARDYTAPSYYAFISYFLTGEHRPYKNAYSGFSRVKPLHNFDNGKGWGAFEVAFRISSFDLTDANQGKLNDLTFGLNWYLNPKTRIMYNYVSANNSDLGLTNKAHLIRFQIDF
jgi:phosphate-selective porin OprO and OprP